MRLNIPLNTIETDVNLAHYDMGSTSTEFEISTQGIHVDTWICPGDFILLLKDVAGRRTLLTEDQEKEIVELCKIIINDCGPIWERQRVCDACDLPFPESCGDCKYSEVEHV